jgi:hypothetical protein
MEADPRSVGALARGGHPVMEAGTFAVLPSLGYDHCSQSYRRNPVNASYS